MAKTFAWYPPPGVTRLGFTVGSNEAGQQMDYATRLALVRGGAPGWTPLVAREFEPFNRGVDGISNAVQQHAERGVGMLLNASAKLLNGSPAMFQDIIDGDYDATLAAQFEVLQAASEDYGLAYLYTWFHEPYAHAQNNSPPGSSKAQQAALYKACYERFHELRDTYAPDVALVQQSTEWQWQPSQGGGLLFWPGSDVCDLAAWTCANAYNAGIDKSWKLPSERRLMALTAETLGVPIVLMAASTPEYVPGNLATSKAAWYADLLATCSASGAIKLVIVADTAWPDTGRISLIDTSPQALAAFQAVAADPRMSNTLTGESEPLAPPTRRTRHAGMLGV